MTVSALVHYFAVTSVLWMGAEALLMFHKVVIVAIDFTHNIVTTKYITTVSIICWSKNTLSNIGLLRSRSD